jgi:hypothetical protein
MQEKQQQEDEEKRLKRRLEKERKEFEEHLKVLSDKADDHCRIFRMRHFGFGPWRKLIERRQQQWIQADEHYHTVVQQRLFCGWRETVQHDAAKKNERADQCYLALLLRRSFSSWQRFKDQATIAEDKAERHYLNHLLMKTLKLWHHDAQTQVLHRWRLEDVANEHSAKRMLKTSFTLWRQHPAERRKERERDKRLTEMRLKVKDLLPDYGGTDTS